MCCSILRGSPEMFGDVRRYHYHYLSESCQYQALILVGCLVGAAWMAGCWLAAGWLAGWLAGCWLAGRLAAGWLASPIRTIRATANHQEDSCHKWTIRIMPQIAPNIIHGLMNYIVRLINGWEPSPGATVGPPSH